MEVVLHIGQLAAYVETVALGYQLEAGGVAGVRSVEYLVRLGVVLEGVAHVVDERVGDTGLEVHSRCNQPVIGAVLDGVGRGIDAHALVVCAISCIIYHRSRYILGRMGEYICSYLNVYTYVRKLVFTATKAQIGHGLWMLF